MMKPEPQKTKHMSFSKTKYYGWAIAAFMLVFAFNACDAPQKEIKDKAGSPLTSQSIYSNQTSSVDSSVNYSFYLPKSYNGKNKLPVVFFLDPHGNGTLPIEKYKDLADKFGYVFIGSNNIKNNVPGNYTSAVFQVLLKEARARFSVDEKRFFVAGFSGGAKLATLFAQQFPEIIGVIATGASLPLVSDQEPTYYYVGIVGNKDFNYLESNQTFSVFDQKGYDYTSIVFDGKHEWAPKSCFDYALCGFQIYSMKTKRIEKDDPWLDALWLRLQDSLAIQKQNNDLFAQHQTLRQADRWFYGLKSIKEIRQQEMALQNNPAFGQMIRKKQRLLKKEITLRTEFIRAIELRDMDWWNNEVANIRQSIGNEDQEIALVSQRLLNYISMASFMLIKTDLDDGKLDDANKKIKIYKLVDPENPDAYLMAARYFMQMDDTGAMTEQFKKAQQLGFTDVETYKKDPSWKALFNNKEINSLL